MRARFHEASSFVVYYGAGGLDEAALFDVAVLESRAHNQDDVARLPQAGCVPVGYLSLMESGEHLPYHQLAAEEDFLRVSGSRIAVPEFNTWVMDPRSPGWRRLIIQEALEILDSRRFAGLFLDTVDRAEDPSLPVPLALEVGAAVAGVIHEIRRLRPGAVLVQNMGLNRLVKYTAPDLDGVCWEAFRVPGGEPSGSSDWTAARLSDLVELSRRHCLRAMLLGSLTGDESGIESLTWARKRGFMYYATAPGYTAGINLAFSRRQISSPQRTER